MDCRSPASGPVIVVGSKVVALDRASGSVLWEYCDTANVRRFHIDEGRVFLYDAGGRVHCLDLRDGRCIGKVVTGISDAESMLVDQDTLFVFGNGVLLAMDLGGRELWRRPVGVSVSCGLVGLGVPGRIMQPDYSRD
jgi:outer membrane protein assembly factor BamB